MKQPSLKTTLAYHGLALWRVLICLCYDGLDAWDRFRRANIVDDEPMTQEQRDAVYVESYLWAIERDMRQLR